MAKIPFRKFVRGLPEQRSISGRFSLFGVLRDPNQHPGVVRVRRRQLNPGIANRPVLGLRSLWNHHLAVFYSWEHFFRFPLSASVSAVPPDPRQPEKQSPAHQDKSCISRRERFALRLFDAFLCSREGNGISTSAYGYYRPQARS